MIFSDGECVNGSRRLEYPTSAYTVILPIIERLYESLVYDGSYVRKLNISYNNIGAEDGVQYSMFDDTEELEHSRKIQSTMIAIKEKYGSNAILKGINYDSVSTARDRNKQIGGHKSGEKTKS